MSMSLESAPPKGSQVMVTPLDISRQVPFKDCAAVVVLVDNGLGKENQMFLSTMSIHQLVFLSKQLDAHITCQLGLMKEGF